MKNKKKLLIIIAVITAVAIIAGIFFGVYYLKGKNDTESRYVSLEIGFTDIKIVNEVTALKAVASVSHAIGISDAEKELKVSAVDTVDGDTYYRFQQYYNEIPVYGKSVAVSADKDGTATALTSNTAKIQKISNATRLSDEEKKDAVIYETDSFKICKTSYEHNEQGNFLVFTDIKTGDVVDSLPQTFTDNKNSYSFKEPDGTYSLFDTMRNLRILTSNGEELKREYPTENEMIIYTNDNSEDRRDVIESSYFKQNKKIDLDYIINDNISTVKSETENKFDSKAMDLINTLRKTYDFYNTFLQRKGFDGHNSLMFASYNDASDGGNNAYSAESILSFGSNYSSNLNSFDLISHEFTHSVERTISNMTYRDESGAIMEGYSDIFGELIEDYGNDGIMNNNQDWINIVNRNMINPTSHETYLCAYELKSQECPVYKKYEKHQYNEEYTVTENECVIKCQYPDRYNKEDFHEYNEVHRNSTIISHSAYLMWNGIDGKDENLKIKTEQLAKLWYRSLFLLHSDATLAQCANAVSTSAAHMVKNGELTPKQLECVLEAFDEVNIKDADSYPTLFSGAKLYVNDINLEKYGNYHLTVKEIPPLRDDIKGKQEKIVIDADVTDVTGYSLDLKEGMYHITITDNSENGSKNEFTKRVKVIKPTVRNEYYAAMKEFAIFTDFGRNVTSLTAHLGLSVSDITTLYGKDFNAVSSSGYIPDGDGTNYLITYEDILPFSFLVENSTSPNTRTELTPDYKIIGVKTFAPLTNFTVDGKIKGDLGYSDLQGEVSGYCWYDLGYEFAYNSTDSTIVFHYDNIPNGNTTTNQITVLAGIFDPNKWTSILSYQAVLDAYAEYCYSKHELYNGSCFYCEYALVDINNDDIKELIVQDGTCEQDRTHHVYTMQNGTPKSIGEYNAWHLSLYNSDSKIIGVDGMGGDWTVYEISIVSGTVKQNVLKNTNIQPSYSSPIKFLPLTEKIQNKRDESSKLSDSDVLKLWSQANDIYCSWTYWREGKGLADTNDTVVLSNNTYQDWTFYKIKHETIKNTADLKKYLKNYFDENICNKILKDYTDHNGHLYCAAIDGIGADMSEVKSATIKSQNNNSAVITLKYCVHDKDYYVEQKIKFENGHWIFTDDFHYNY